MPQANGQGRLMYISQACQLTEPSLTVGLLQRLPRHVAEARSSFDKSPAPEGLIDLFVKRYSISTQPGQMHSQQKILIAWIVAESLMNDC